MACGRRTTRIRRFRAWLCVVLGAALVTGSCSSGDRRGKESTSPIATVRGREISESDVAALADDAGFLAFIGAPEPEHGAALSGTEAGRRTLTWLIDKSLVDAEVETQHLDVDDETLERTTADLRAGQTPPELDVVVESDQPMGEDALAQVAQGLAAYATLDQWLRTIEPTDPELRDRILTEHPEVRDRICGSAVAVDEADATAVGDVLRGGGTLAQVPADLALARTPPEGQCLPRGTFRRPLVDVLYGTPVGAAGQKRVISRSTGKPVVFFVVPSAHDRVPEEEADDAVTATLQRLHDEGGAAFAELGFSTVDPHLAGAWGRWDPTVGVVPSDAAPRFSTFDLPAPTTTTSAAPTTTAPPPPAPPASFEQAAEPILQGSGAGDPGTADLVARSKAAMESVVPGAWRQALPLQYSIIAGHTSLSSSDGQLKVGEAHASGDWFKLQAIMAHELGHHVGFHYGSQAEYGAAPAGWPASGETPVERWADCVSETYTSYGIVSKNSGPCQGESLSWTQDWLAAGPDAHPRTG